MCFLLCLGADAEVLRISIWNPENDREAQNAQLVLRSFDSPALTEMDVICENGVAISFATVWGAAHRARCEIVFADQSAWLGLCEIYTEPFNGPSELVKVLKAGKGVRSATYFVSSRQQNCGALLVSGRKAEDLPFQIEVETAHWNERNRVCLDQAFSMVGSYGVPMLGESLNTLWSLDQPLVAESDRFEEVEEIPEEIWAKLDSERAEGLGEWLDDFANTLP